MPPRSYLSGINVDWIDWIVCLIVHSVLALSNDVSVSLSASARNLGFIFDSRLTFSNQVSAVILACFYSIHDHRRIRPVLIFDTAHTVDTSFFAARCYA